MHKELYNNEMVTANPAPGTDSAYPSPSSITLYKASQGYPDFDAKKADAYFRQVNTKLTALILEMKQKWDMAGL